MKTFRNIFLIAVYLILLSIAWSNPERYLWKFVFVTALVYIGWIAYELKRAPEMDDDGFGEKIKN